MRKRALAVTAMALGVAVALGWSPGHRYWRAGKMLTALSSAHAAAGPSAEAGSNALVEEDLTVDGAGGRFRARIYRRAARRAGAV